MGGALIVAKIEDQGVRNQLAEIQARVGNMRPVWAEIGQILLESIMNNFLQHRAPDGTPWKPVSAAYTRWKSKKGKNPSEILTLGSRLRNSINARAETDSVTIGTNVVYAAIHQFGGAITMGGRSQTLAHDKGGRFMSRKKASKQKTGSVRVSIATIGAHAVDMPARPFLGARDEDWGRISTALAKYIVSGQV